jgi:hypothetical protein
MEDADLKAVHLVELIYRDSGRSGCAGKLLSYLTQVTNSRARFPFVP